MQGADFAREENSSKATLQNLNVDPDNVQPEK